MTNMISNVECYMKKDNMVNQYVIGVMGLFQRDLGIDSPSLPRLSEYSSPLPLSPPLKTISKVNKSYLLHSIPTMTLDMTLITLTILFAGNIIIVLGICIVLIVHLLSYLIPLMKVIKKERSYGEKR